MSILRDIVAFVIVSSCTVSVIGAFIYVTNYPI